MNKSELALRISDSMHVSKKNAEDFLSYFQEIVTHTLHKGDDVTLAGFGTFSARTRSARMGVNPRKPQEKIQVPEVRVPKFKAGKALKDALKKPLTIGLR